MILCYNGEDCYYCYYKSIKGCCFVPEASEGLLTAQAKLYYEHYLNQIWGQLTLLLLQGPSSICLQYNLICVLILIIRLALYYSYCSHNAMLCELVRGQPIILSLLICCCSVMQQANNTNNHTSTSVYCCCLRMQRRCICGNFIAISVRQHWMMLF